MHILSQSLRFLQTIVQFRRCRIVDWIACGSRLVQWQFSAQKVLDTLKKARELLSFKSSKAHLIHLHIVLCYKSHCYARSASTRGATDAMDVVFRMLWHVDIDNNINVRYIESTVTQIVALSFNQEAKLAD